MGSCDINHLKALFKLFILIILTICIYFQEVTAVTILVALNS